MGKIVVDASEVGPVTGICESAWGRNACPNQAEHLIVNRTNNGFAVMCGPHANAFVEQYEGRYDVESYSRERDEFLRDRLRREGPADG